KRQQIYQPLLEALNIEKLQIARPTDLKLKDFRSGHFLVAGSDLKISRQLIGKISSSTTGARLRVFKNPFDPAGRILIADITKRSEAKAIQHKLRHYGSYSHLIFKQGRNIRKESVNAANGVLLYDNPSTQAFQPDQIASLDTILPLLAGNRVIHVGEQHNRFAHHINQLHIIRYMHQNGFDFGVGMEMFKQPYQATVDAYLA
ncbi:MAG: ChaN family lipoprotein, partial [Hyphomicrobiales bacterium]|nr:ChaN family lipoprotein [Hyphomicrobiales bacterium]